MAIVDKKEPYRDRREYYKQWRKKNPGRNAALLQSYRSANPKKAILNRLKQNAKEKNLEFALEENDINIPVICPILGIPIYDNYTPNGKKGPRPNSISVDRLDNNKGYIKKNVWVISNLANTMKNKATPEQLIRFANWIIYTYGGK